MARAGTAGPKSSTKQAFDLSERPDALFAARLWVLDKFFGVQLRGWQLEQFANLGGMERPRVAYIQVPRKNGKSFLIACFILTEIILLPGRHTYGISDSEKSLVSVLMLELDTLIGRSQDAMDALHQYASKVMNPGNDSFFEVRASTFAASQGINPHVVVFDEVHLQKDDRIWNGMQASGAARRADETGPGALLLGVTTPGYDTTSVAHALYQRAKAGTSAMYARIYEPEDPNADHTDRSLWAVANPVAAEDPEFLDIMALDLELMPEHDFRRFRLGQWTATSKAWLPYGAWTSLSVGKTAEELEFDTSLPTYLGFDGSYSGDSTGIVAVNTDGQVRVVGLWERPLGRAGDGWRVPRDEVTAAVHGAFAEFNVVRLLADPPYWQSEIQEWRRAYPNRVYDFSTGVPARMAPACTAFYTAVMEGRLTDCTTDPQLRQALANHLNNCVTRDTPFGTTVVKSQKWSPLKIDLAVATLIAAHPATRPQKQVGEIRVLWV